MSGLIRFPARGAPAAISRAIRSPDAIARDERVWTQVRASSPTEYQRTGKSVRQLGFERHPVVQACVRAIVDVVAAVPLEVYRKRADGTSEVIPRHPAAALLNAPRPSLTAHALRARTATPFVTFGNAFWYLERASPRAAPRALRVIPPEHLLYAYLDAATDEIIQYDWRDLQGTVHRSPAVDVVHFRDLDAGDGLFGYPRAAAALLDISTDHEATQYVRQVVGNHGVPGLAVKTKGYKDKVQLLAAETSFNERMVARGGRGGATFINAEEVEFEQLGFNLQELEFPDLRAIAREDICAAFGVDPRMIGIASAANDGGLSGAQFREARFRLIQQTVLPVMKAIESTLDHWVMPEFGDVYARFSPDGLAELTEDEAATSTRVLAEVTGGIRTREEARETIGLPAVMDPAHTLVGPMSRLEYPVRLQFAHTQPQPAQEEDDALGGRGPAGSGAGAAARPDEAETRADAAVAPAAEGAGRQPAAAAGAVASALTARSRFVRRGVSLSADQRAELWALFDTRATAQEGPYVRAAAVLFDAERADVARLFASAVPAERSAVSLVRRADEDPVIAEAERRILEGYAPGGAYHEAWLARYRALIAETVTVAGGELAASIGVSFTLENPRVQSVIRERAGALVTHVTDTTREQIRAAIAVGREAGMGVREIAKLIDESVYGEPMTRQRATVIARTETVGALNAGEFATAVDSGVMRSKEWMTQGDGRVRDSHQVLDGQRVAIEARFANGLLHPHAPGAPAKEVVQCRCTLLFSDEDPPA